MARRIGLDVSLWPKVVFTNFGIGFGAIEPEVRLL
jgi:hypothetical protein